MTVPKKYFHDRLILLLLSVNTFLAILGSVLIGLNLNNGHSNGYIVQYRANLGLSAFKSGNVTTFISFILFALFTLVFNTILSIRIYHVRRLYSVVVLTMATLLIILVLVVSNALLFNNR